MRLIGTLQKEWKIMQVETAGTHRTQHAGFDILVSEFRDRAWFSCPWEWTTCGVLKLPNLNGTETERGGLRESSWGSPPPMIHPHGGVWAKSHSSRVRNPQIELGYKRRRNLIMFDGALIKPRHTWRESRKSSNLPYRKFKIRGILVWPQIRLVFWYLAESCEAGPRA
jgi:hypothetical protein